MPNETDTLNTVSPGCSWYDHRFNVVPHGTIAAHTPSVFIDSLNDAIAVRDSMRADGIDNVDVYDTVDGLFY